MNEGFFVDFAENGARVAHWIAGKPEFGLLGGTKTWGKLQHPVQTFRCRKCGCLESYAPGA